MICVLLSILVRHMEYHIGVLFRQRLKISLLQVDAFLQIFMQHKSPRDLDANLLRQKLASQGVCLEQFVYNTPLVDEK